ncbi:MAG TPA: nucleoside diphosphate kinase regulator [Chloroflexaceae bacterium]|nr:nucleoside diphosphate kinase regulator [Chloroflexaceae bacterium]
MSDRAIAVTQSDMERLRLMLAEERECLRRANSNGHGDAHLRALEAELDRATLLSADEAPGEIVTMHAEAHLTDLDTGEELCYTLVFPEEADVRRQRISVLAPIGTAMLGYRVGDVFEWPVPDGLRRLKIVRVQAQPEAAERPAPAV